MSYETTTVDTEYGEKLAITGVDKSVIKGTEWGVVHYEPCYPGDYDGLDDFAWAVEISEESLKQVRRATGSQQDEFYLNSASDDSGPEVTLRRDPAENVFHIDGGRAIGVLDNFFSYENPDAEFDPSIPEVEHVVDRRQGTAPLGLVDRAAAILEAEGFDVTLAGPESGVKGDAIDVSWHFEEELRDYQNEAAHKIAEEQTGVIELPTGTGKTVTALHAIRQVGRKTMVFVHTRELLYQWADEIRDLLGVEPGIIGDGEWREGDQVTVAIMQSLVSKGTSGADGDAPLSPAEYGMAIYDEAHRTSVADTMHRVGQLFPSAFRLGLSATPWRRNEPEEIWINGAIGPVIYSRGAEYMIRQGYLARPRFETIEHDGPTRNGRAEEYHDAYKRCIEHSDARNDAIAKKAVGLSQVGRRTIVNVNRIDQAHFIVEKIAGRDSDVTAEVVTSDTVDRDEKLAAFGNGEIDVVVSTLLKEGVDIPDVNAIILAHGGKSAVEVIQTIGRALRPTNGDDALIVDVRDEGMSFGDAYTERRAVMNDYYGGFGPDGDAEIEQSDLAADGGAEVGDDSDEQDSTDDEERAEKALHHFVSDEDAKGFAANLLRKAAEGKPLTDDERDAAALLADELDSE